MSRRLLATVATALALTLTSACGVSTPEQDAAPQPGDRVVKHAKGQATINGTPKRVVVLDTGELDSVLALGVKPVGTVLPDGSQSLPPYLADQAGKVESVGTIGSPNLEKITALKPDLILSSKVRDDDKYDALSKIAPTVFSETVGKTWKENFLLDAKALGKEPEAQQIMDRYQQRARSIGDKAGDPAATKVSMLRSTSGGNDLRLYGQGSFIGTILGDAGFGRPQNQLNDETFTKISREQVSQADGDLLFYGAYGDTARANQQELVASEQWRNLDAARTGKAFEVSDEVWYLGLGPLAANLVLDDLEKHVSPK